MATNNTRKSIEEKVEEYFKTKLNELGIRHYGKTEEINSSITDALKNANSKSGGKGNNYPDIQLLLDDNHGRRIPVMIEAKGTKGKLEKLTKDDKIELVSKSKNEHSAVQQYAVNGAYHYGLAILTEGTYDEVIIVGINGSELNDNGKLSNPEVKAYYISVKNDKVPKEIQNFTFGKMTGKNINAFYTELDSLTLTEEEKEQLKRDMEVTLEKSIKNIHQRIYGAKDLKSVLGTSDKLYLFIGLILAGLKVNGVKPLEVTDLDSFDNEYDNDGDTVLKKIKAVLKTKHCSAEKIDTVLSYLNPVFKNHTLWAPVNGESIIKSIFKQIKKEILPLLEGKTKLDFTGRILNSLNDWVGLENDAQNDVVLTPAMVMGLMARIARTNKDSFVWDTCAGSSGFLVTAKEIMDKDAYNTIHDPIEREKKLENINKNQLLGVEILGNIYLLSVLNMILVADGNAQIIHGDSHEVVKSSNFPANVFLLNPPYSAEGNGLIFAEEAMAKMENGYGAVLIQESAGSGRGGDYAKNILKKHTLVASIHMPKDLFIGKAGVQTSIYLFEVGKPHNVNKLVTFIDFSEDGYARQARKKSSQDVNLKNVDHAIERYDEIAAICLGEKTKTSYYTEDNGKVVKDTISLNGDDWTFSQHQVIDNTTTDDDFQSVINNFAIFNLTQKLNA